jgi:resuscitation-promoting factor RpfB
VLIISGEGPPCDLTHEYTRDAQARCQVPRPGEYHHWSVVRSSIALLSKSRIALVALVAAVVAALVATTVGYAAMSKTVTLSVDGEAEQVSTMGGTVGDVLEAEGVDVGQRDVVAPGLDSKVDDGTRIAVRYARELQVTVDGEQRSYWVTATDVDSALDQLGIRAAGAELSVSRSAEISRQGLDLEVVTPKDIKLKDGAGKARKVTVPALTVADAIDELGLKVDGNDKVKPRPKATLEDGDKVVITKVRTAQKKVTEAIDFSTVEKTDSSMLEGNTKVVRSGEAGKRQVVYKLRFENGKLVDRKSVRSKVLDRPKDAIVRVGTKEPAPAPTPSAPSANFASGSTVWDQLAQCESGGNWAINTGNGYYGGLQFNLETWRAYGGSGYPHENSREQQITIAEKVRNARGGYGAWPHCSQQLGLPQG